jgi:hypothetical protein
VDLFVLTIYHYKDGGKENKILKLISIKFIALLLNVILFLFGIFIIVEERKANFAIILLLTVTPLANFIALLMSGSENFIGLYLRRRALEEKKKIQELEDK